MSLGFKIVLTAAVIGALLWFTASIQSALTPFALAAVFTYVMAPLAEKMESRGMPPAAAAAVVVLLLILLLAALPFALLPLITAQLRELLALLPHLIEKANQWLGGDVAGLLAPENFDLNSVGLAGAKQAANVITGIFGGGLAALGTLFSVALITPLATFYFLRDRQSIGGELTEILPPHWREQALHITRDLDNVLGEFLHGQLLVMLIMSVFYAAVLKLAGLDFALTIGVISGILVFIPYVGFILGVFLATIVALNDLQSVWDLVVIWALMGIGTTLESIAITPRLVGERVGLHPLMVLFSLLVMGELFGFVGVLISLPAAAILLVCGRYLRRYYIGSSFYGRS